MRHTVLVCMSVVLGFALLAGVHAWVFRYAVVSVEDVGAFEVRTQLVDRWTGVPCQRVEVLDFGTAAWRPAPVPENRRDCGGR